MTALFNMPPRAVHAVSRSHSMQPNLPLPELVLACGEHSGLFPLHFSPRHLCPPHPALPFAPPRPLCLQHEAGKSTYHFLPTPPMPTYLVAFVVGELVQVSRSVEGPPGSGIGPRNVSVWGTPNRWAGGRAQGAAVATPCEGHWAAPVSMGPAALSLSHYPSVRARWRPPACPHPRLFLPLLQLQAPEPGVCCGRRLQDPARLRAHVWGALPAAQAGPGGHPRLCGGGHGELG